MRLFLVLPFLSQLFGASASSLDSRRPDAHPLDARDVSNVCATLNSGEFYEAGYPEFNTLFVLLGITSVCVCQSDAFQFLDEDYGGIFQGTISPSNLSSLIVENAPTNCNYPVNAVPTCNGLQGNPCDFTCANGFTPYPSDSPTDCICVAPNVICNGNCVDPSTGCPSSQATPQKRWVGSGSCTERGYGWAACGVFGGGARAWECVNTARDLESCGGCVLPLTPFSPIGQDCTSLPGVADVSCLSGGCVVHRCMPGYSLSHDGSHCTPAQAHIPQPYISSPEDDEEYMQALRYGLEHRPLHIY